MLPSFDDYLATLDEERMKDIFETDTDALNVSTDLNDPGWANTLAIAICSYSSGVTLKLLKSYHEWLQKQIP